ncbi:hypothetical protein Nepgr_002055 [Nepenthes gracilis]|uniref:ZF-HD dimerization-type domain-containing protein n=1 Tax=Nepenthes gracilis TaxID=150966 RepID=A0AAD3RXZ2_NEPGR|nr:hypothetical protein Nepgr_002055 [Nepenthes gracilis]
MEFDHDHDEEQEEEEEGDEEINLDPPQSYNSIAHSARLRVNPFGGNGGSMAAPPVSGRDIGIGATKYKECLKNHAVSIGGHAVDGCGEFMPAGEEGTLDALKCAACSCHRNFHRKETHCENVVPPTVVGGGAGTLYTQFSPYYRTPYFHVASAGMATTPSGAQHRPLALPSSSPSPSGGTHSRDEMEDISHPSSSGGGGGVNHSGSGGSGFLKKRFRTKFSQEQKDKMLAFAEKLGWRVQKHDEAAVQQFCEEVQVKRHVLKVWMHNNKHTLGKKP